MTRPARSALSKFSKVVLGVTFLLIFFGAMVTSKDAGLSVPDWPKTFGHNMFLYPPSGWRGLVFWEHTHRLIGSALGMLVIGLVVWIFRADSRQWARWYGIIAFILVVIQGLMGGFRVTEKSVTLAIIHGVTAQLFFCLIILIALYLSPKWSVPAAAGVDCKAVYGIRRWAWSLFALVLIQLVLGALMRHWGAGLAIPTFPLTPDGRLMPSVHTPEIDVHFTHRIWAVVVCIMSAIVGFKALKAGGADGRIAIPAWYLVIGVAAQFLLGAYVIWESRHPVITTFHVVNGAILLGCSFVLVVRAYQFKWLGEASRENLEPAA